MVKKRESYPGYRHPGNLYKKFLALSRLKEVTWWGTRLSCQHAGVFHNLA
jgi:hypothetical protein